MHDLFGDAAIPPSGIYMFGRRRVTFCAEPTGAMEMGIGPDEKLMQSINAHAELFDARRAAFVDLHDLARRLHEIHAHRPVEQIEERLRLILSARGIPLKEKQPFGYATAIFSEPLGNRHAGVANQM